MNDMISHMIDVLCHMMIHYLISHDQQIQHNVIIIGHMITTTMSDVYHMMSHDTYRQWVVK